MKENADRLKRRLKSIGLSDPAIKAAWPTWWSDAADASASAQTELRFSLARKLGLDPHSLLDSDNPPRFIWKDEARFKHLSTETILEQSAITSFATAVGRLILKAAASGTVLSQEGMTADSLRSAILREQPFVRLVDLLSVCWTFGIPVVHLRVFPCAQKRMAAMTVRVENRTAIFIGKDSVYPAHIAFYLAHELAHIALGHLADAPIVVDLDPFDDTSEGDEEEIKADSFALQLLTGRSKPKVLPKDAYNARELARVALASGPELGIEPGTLALCFGYTTGDWATANAAMRSIYTDPISVWSQINRLAINELNLAKIPEDARHFLLSILGHL